jgi:hypothetical protein
VKRASVRVGTEVELQQRQYDVSVREVSLANWYGVNGSMHRVIDWTNDERLHSRD